MNKLFEMKFWCLHKLEHELLALMATMAIVLSVSANPALADDAICLNNANAFGGTTGISKPIIDGVIPTDIGWLRANQYVFGNGTTTPDGVVQMIRNSASSGNGESLYISFQINHDDHYNPADKIILILGPDINDATKDMRIHIHPVNTSGNVGGYPYKISVWKNSNVWANNSQSPDFNFTQQNQGWMNAKVVTVDGSADLNFQNTKDNSYSIELEIPIVTLANNQNGIYLPNNNIKMHFNILRVYLTKVGTTTLTKVAGQLNWPSNALLTGVPTNPTDQILFSQPARLDWGNAVLNSPNVYGCSGVQVDTAWLNNDQNNHSVLNVPPVNSTALNTYHIRLKNTGTTDASKIRATIGAHIFGIANIDSFGLVPAIPNPVGPSGVIPQGGTLTLPTATWNTTRAQYESLIGQSPYVCSLIQLDVDPSMAGKVQIANRYYYWNTHFGSASNFEHRAVLSTDRFKKTSTGIQQFDIKVFAKEVPPFDRGGVTTVNLKEGGLLRDKANLQKNLRDISIQEELSQLGGAIELYRGGEKFYEKTVCAFRSIDQYIRMDGVTMELKEKTPCYGYWIHHKGEITGWTDSLEGEGIKKDINGSNSEYTVNIVHGKSIELATRIETVETPPPPPCPCGTTCPNVGATLQTSDNKLAGTGFFWFGIAGIGALAFTRRRRDKCSKEM